MNKHGIALATCLCMSLSLGGCVGISAVTALSIAANGVTALGGMPQAWKATQDMLVGKRWPWQPDPDVKP